MQGLAAATISDKAAPCPLDHVNRQFKAPRPNALRLSYFTYVATWTGFVYVTFVIDAYARRIVGWRASRTAHAGFVLDVLEQALHDRRPIHRGGLVHAEPRSSGRYPAWCASTAWQDMSSAWIFRARSYCSQNSLCSSSSSHLKMVEDDGIWSSRTMLRILSPSAISWQISWASSAL